MSFGIMFFSSLFFVFGRLVEGCKPWKAILWGFVCFSMFFTGNVALLFANEILRQLLV